MRRKDKEIKDRQKLDQIIKKTQICRLALCDENRPYIIPLNFGYEDNCLYIHSAPEGRKIDILKKNPQVCFEMENDTALVEADEACKWSMDFTSIIGSGRAGFLEDRDEKRKALDIIMNQYSDRTDFSYPDRAVDAVAVIKINIEEIRGKQSAG